MQRTERKNTIIQDNSRVEKIEGRFESQRELFLCRRERERERERKGKCEVEGESEKVF
jgi:hypothetical protein